MIYFAAPAGTTQALFPEGEFDPDTGILSLTDAAGAALSDALIAIGFTKIGSNPLSTTRVVTGSFSASGRSDPILAIGTINVSVWPVDPATSVTAAFSLERSFDGGATWLPVTALAEPLALTGAFSTSFTEAETGVVYSLNCPAFAGPAANYRLSRA